MLDLFRNKKSEGELEFRAAVIPIAAIINNRQIYPFEINT